MASAWAFSPSAAYMHRGRPRFLGPRSGPNGDEVMLRCAHLVLRAEPGVRRSCPWGFWDGHHRRNGPWWCWSSGDGARSVIPSWPRGFRPALLSGTKSRCLPRRRLSGRRGSPGGIHRHDAAGMGPSMAWGRRIAQVFLSGCPKLGYQTGDQRPTAPRASSDPSGENGPITAILPVA